MVDDSVVVRHLFTKLLSSDPDLEVVGVAANGQIALQRIDQINPDIVTLDVEMPEMDGLQALKEIRKTHPRLPVIMVSSLTERGARVTLDAIALGATDYVTKGIQGQATAEVMGYVRDELIPKIKTFCASILGKLSTPTTAIRPPRPTAAARKVDIVVIGASTGGPNALAKMLSDFPSDFPIPIAVVQHMPAIFTKLLATRLSATSLLKVAEGANGVILRPGTATVAPGDFHMALTRVGSSIYPRVFQAPPENSCRPAVDVLFRTAAEVFGPGALAVVLTGMGQDGLRGCQAISDAGGQILAQDRPTSVVWGMPGFVANAGLADAVLPLDQIALEVQRRVRLVRPSKEPR